MQAHANVSPGNTMREPSPEVRRRIRWAILATVAALYVLGRLDSGFLRWFFGLLQF
jgi:hypothetical protein